MKMERVKTNEEVISSSRFRPHEWVSRSLPCCLTIDSAARFRTEPFSTVYKALVPLTSGHLSTSLLRHLMHAGTEAKRRLTGAVKTAKEVYFFLWVWPSICEIQPFECSCLERAILQYQGPRLKTIGQR